VLVGLIGVLDPVPARADEAADAFQAGRRLLREQKPREAAEAFQKVARLDSSYPEVYIYLGDALLQLKKYEEALACYGKSLATDPPSGGEVFRALEGVGCVYLAVASEPKKEDLTEPMQKKFINDAIRCFDQVIKISPKYAPVYNNRGRAYHLKGDTDRAIADFSKAIELDPAFADAYENRGKAWGGKGDQKRADADAEKARELRAKKK
jgi:tetratricopeptide (TPR) repeat protein